MKSTDWLIRGISEKKLSRIKKKAIESARKELKKKAELGFMDISTKIYDIFNQEQLMSGNMSAYLIYTFTFDHGYVKVKMYNQNFNFGIKERIGDFQLKENSCAEFMTCDIESVANRLFRRKDCPNAKNYTMFNILDIYVDPKYRKRYLGSKMIERVTSYIKDMYWFPIILCSSHASMKEYPEDPGDECMNISTNLLPFFLKNDFIVINDFVQYETQIALMHKSTKHWKKIRRTIDKILSNNEFADKFFGRSKSK